MPRVSLPFQVIETINESRATREANKLPLQPSLFDIYEGKEGDTFEEGWDVRDVSVVLGLRPFTAKAEILPECVVIS